MRSFNKLLLLTCTGALFLTGCAGTGSVTGTTVPEPVVRFVNASPGSGALDFFLNEAIMANNLAFRASTPGFVTVESGDYDVSVQANNDPETQAIEQLVLLRDTDHIVVATGLVTPPNQEFDKRLRLTDIRFDRRSPNSNARLMVINGYIRAEGLDTPNIDFQEPGDTPRFFVRNIEFGNAAQIESLEAGPRTFVARRAGTEGELTPPVTFTFEAGKIYLAVVAGIEDSPTTPPTISFIEIQTR